MDKHLLSNILNDAKTTDKASHRPTDKQPDITAPKNQQEPLNVKKKRNQDGLRYLQDAKVQGRRKSTNMKQATKQPAKAKQPQPQAQKSQPEWVPLYKNTAPKRKLIPYDPKKSLMPSPKRSAKEQEPEPDIKESVQKKTN